MSLSIMWYVADRCGTGFVSDRNTSLNTASTGISFSLSRQYLSCKYYYILSSCTCLSLFLGLLLLSVSGSVSDALSLHSHPRTFRHASSVFTLLIELLLPQPTKYCCHLALQTTCSTHPGKGLSAPTKKVSCPLLVCYCLMPCSPFCGSPTKYLTIQQATSRSTFSVSQPERSSSLPHPRISVDVNKHTQNPSLRRRTPLCQVPASLPGWKRLITSRMGQMAQHRRGQQ